MATQSINLDYPSVDVGSLGAIVGVSSPQGTWFKGFGYADADNTPMQANMQFRIASNTKVFTAVAILKLVDAGMLMPSDFVSTYLPNPNPALADWSRITVEELANHTSGIVGPRVPSTNTHYDPLTLFQYATESDPPKQDFNYANINFTALALVAQNVTGQTLDQIYQQSLFSQLNLTDTVDAVSGTQPQLLCHGYQNGADVTNYDPTYSWGAGTIVSTVEDMTTWIQAVGRGTLLSPNSEDTLLYIVAPAIETGFGIQENNGWIGHLGDIAGYASACFYNPLLDASVVVMVNRRDVYDGTNGFRRQYPILNDVISAFFPNNPIGLHSSNEG